MKKKKHIQLILLAAVIIFVHVLMAVMVYRSSPYAYVRNIVKSNEAALDQLTSLMRDHTENNKHLEYREDDIPDDIGDVLGKLKSEYQKDSEWPVFSGVEVYFDGQGDVMYLLQVRKERLRAGNGKDSPDIRCCYLIYMDDAYDGKQPEAAADVLYGNWHYWSEDLYSG